MTQSTDQERAQALAEKHGATSYRNRADTQNPAYGFTPIQLAALIAEVEQAALRAQLDDIGVVDMAQAVDSKEAAHVQMPEPVAKIEGGSLKWHIPDAGYSLPVRYLQGTQMLYTEHQVRQLLAAQEQPHGQQT